jgi:glycogen operon protein
MTTQEWNHDFARCLGVYLSGVTLGELDVRGRPVRDDDFVVLFNAHHDTIEFSLPDYGADGWLVLVDTDRDDGLLPDGTFQPRRNYAVAGRSLVLLQRLPQPG